MTLKMTSAQVVETSVIVNNNSSFQNYTNPDDHTQQTIDYIFEKKTIQDNNNNTKVLLERISDLNALYMNIVQYKYGDQNILNIN